MSTTLCSGLSVQLHKEPQLYHRSLQAGKQFISGGKNTWKAQSNSLGEVTLANVGRCVGRRGFASSALCQQLGTEL